MTATTQNAVRTLYTIEIKDATDLLDALVGITVDYIPNEYITLIDNEYKTHPGDEYRYYPVIDRMIYLGRRDPKDSSAIIDSTGKKYVHKEGPGDNQFSLCRADTIFTIDNKEVTLLNSEQRSWPYGYVCQIVGNRAYFMTDTVHHSVGADETFEYAIRKYEANILPEKVADKKIAMNTHLRQFSLCVMTTDSDGSIWLAAYHQFESRKQSSLIVMRCDTKLGTKTEIDIDFPYRGLHETFVIGAIPHQNGLWLVVNAFNSDDKYNITEQFKVLYDIHFDLKSANLSPHPVTLCYRSEKYKYETVFVRDYSNRLFIFSPDEKVMMCENNAEKYGYLNTIKMGSDIPKCKYQLRVMESVCDVWD